MDVLWQHLKYGVRQLWQSPGFTLVAVASLALGIGANTAIFQLIDSVRMRTLPVTEPDRLAIIDFGPNSTRSGWFSTRSARLTGTHWELIAGRQQSFASVAAYSTSRFNLADRGQARYAEGLFVSSAFFSTLGLQPAVGQFFASQSDKPGCTAPGAVLQHAFWQREFAGNPGVLGQSILLDGKPFSIVGVAPAGFFGFEVGSRFDVAVPMCSDPMFSDDGSGRATNRTAWWLSMVGRLKPGKSIEQATAELSTISRGIMEDSLPPTYRPETARNYLNNKLVATPGGTGVSNLRRTYTSPLWILMAISGLVLLIACANLANLLLARASIREREMAVRLAIGASRGRLIGQLLVESLLLAILGVGFGALAAVGLSRGLVALLTTENNRLFVNLHMDWQILGFAAALGLTTCLLFGLLPAMRATRVAPAASIRSGGRGMTAGRERFSARRALVVAQVAMSLVLLVGAMLFVRSFQKLVNVETGFQSEGILALSVDMRKAAYGPERIAVVWDEVTAALRNQPGVVSAASVGFTPISGSAWDGQVRPAGSTGETKRTYFNRIGPDYFRTMGTPMVAGREFTDRDTRKAPQVMVINEVFAERVFPGQNPVGRMVEVEAEAGKASPVYQIVGVVKKSKYGALREEYEPVGYYPRAQDERPGAGMTFVVRIAGGSAGAGMTAVKDAVASVNGEASIEMRILTEQLRDSLLRERLMATLSGGFGFLAAALATLGLYGVISYMVARRRNEIGVRMALGADRRSVVGLVLKEAGVLLAYGTAFGIVLALAAGTQAESLLYGLKAWDPVIIASATALLAVVAIAASYMPAARASRIDPMVALREE